MINQNDLPDIMYFGSSKPINELKGRVFLTPHIGIASLFIIDIGDLFPKGYRTRCNLSYRQWNMPNDMLTEPLNMVNIVHNIVFYENKIFKGQSSGYIHAIDITNVKDKLTLFTTNDPDREVVYSGEEPLTIISITPHTLLWELAFHASEARKHGVGVAEPISESL